MIKAIAITGPTASGKTALSIDIAGRIGAEIISADSMQIYKEMDIGTAKATEGEQAAVPHHMIDVVSPLESFSVEAYRERALIAARDITARGLVPLFVGGTGLYVDSFTRSSQSDAPMSDPAYRDRLLAQYVGEQGRLELWRRLTEIDPESAEKIHYNNVKRVIRALEIYDTTGVTKSELDRRSKEKSTEIDVGMVTLDFHERELLYSRIDKRVGMMLDDGLVSEVESLYKRGLLPDGTTASQAIGYKELIGYIRGECTLDEAADAIRLASRRYAKRQLTWFRHRGDACRVFVDDGAGKMRNFADVSDEIFAFINNFLSHGSVNERKL